MKNISRAQFVVSLLMLSILWIVFRLYDLSDLPVFNDESIYIDWAWRSINLPGFAFFSLLDGKQPLVLWGMGFWQRIFSDLLWASRFASVGYSALAAVGVYVSARLLYSARSIAILAVVLYICAPIFVFFDRQALYESATSAAIVWLFVSAIWFVQRPSLLRGASLGVLLGVGLWIKFSVLLTCIPLLLVLMLGLGRAFFRKDVLGYLTYGVFLSQLILIFLYIQLSMQRQGVQLERYIFTTAELLNTSIVITWIRNGVVVLETVWWWLTPALVLPTVWYGKKLVYASDHSRLLVVYTGVLLLELILTAHAVIPRYVASTLVLVPLIAAAGLYELRKSHGALPWRILGIGCIATTVAASLLLVVRPQYYLRLVDAVSQYSLANEYLDNWTSGQPSQDAVAFLQEQLRNEPGIVFIRRDAGNPESHVLYSFHENKTTEVLYLDAMELPDLPQAQCIKSTRLLFYISRDYILPPTQWEWQELARFYTESSAHSVGVYSPEATECVEGALQLY